MWTRRQVLLGGLLTVISYSTGSNACFAQQTRNRVGYGCMLSDEEADQYWDNNTDSELYITGDEPMIPRSGIKDFDLALANTLAKISRALDVLPGFAYYDDYDGENAYATSRVRLKNADGTVLFGQGLLKRLLDGEESPEVSVAAVCAHEFGHILQYKHGLDQIVGAGQPTVKRIELQADFFAGYFAGIRKLERPTFPAAVFATTQFSFGDKRIDHPGHHGTHEERSSAIVKGFDAAYNQKRSLVEAIQIGTSYVRKL